VRGACIDFEFLRIQATLDSQNITEGVLLIQFSKNLTWG
jgi:hypothetical protein